MTAAYWRARAAAMRAHAAAYEADRAALALDTIGSVESRAKGADHLTNSIQQYAIMAAQCDKQALDILADEAGMLGGVREAVQS